MVHLVHQSHHVVWFTAMRIQELESHRRVPQSKTPDFFFTEGLTKKGTRNWNLTNTLLSILVIYSISKSRSFQTHVSHPRSSCGTVIIPMIAMVCRTLTARPVATAMNWRGKAVFFAKHYRETVLLLFSDLLVKRAIFHLKHWSDKFGPEAWPCEPSQNLMVPESSTIPPPHTKLPRTFSESMPLRFDKKRLWKIFLKWLLHVDFVCSKS